MKKEFVLFTLLFILSCSSLWAQKPITEKQTYNYFVDEYGAHQYIIVLETTDVSNFKKELVTFLKETDHLHLESSFIYLATKEGDIPCVILKHLNNAEEASTFNQLFEEKLAAQIDNLKESFPMSNVNFKNVMIRGTYEGYTAFAEEHY